MAAQFFALAKVPDDVRLEERCWRAAHGSAANLGLLLKQHPAARIEQLLYNISIQQSAMPFKSCGLGTSTGW